MTSSLDSARSPILVIFNTVDLYGMERAVLQSMDLLAREVEPHFLLSRTVRRRNLPVWQEILRLGFGCHFLSDHQEWPRLGKPRGVLQIVRLARVWLRGNLDVLQAFRKSRARALLMPSPSYALFGLLAGLYCRARGFPAILQFHNLELDYSRLLRGLSPIYTDCCHCTERGMELTLAANPYLKRKNNHVIPNRIPDRPAQPLPEIDPGRRRLVFIGQLSRHKGADLMLSAFLKIAESHRDVDLDLVGDGPAEFVDQLRQMGQAAAPRIRFWGYRDKPEQILAGATAHLFPTPPSRYHESFGNVAVEAMALGVPSVTFASGSVPSLVMDGENGFVVEPESAEGFAEAIEVLLSQPERRQAMAENARRRYEDHFSDEVILRAWRKLIERIR